MLFRLVRPMKRAGSRNLQFVRRIPSDVKGNLVGRTLSIPVGGETVRFTVAPKTQSIRLSLRTDDPAEVKIRQAHVSAYLDTVFRAFREDAPVSLNRKQATALAGELYRAWSNGEDRERTTAIEFDETTREWVRVDAAHSEPEEWAAAIAKLDEIAADDKEEAKREGALGAIIDRLLLRRGIRRVDAPTRTILLQAFLEALRDAFASRQRNATNDFSPDPKAARFPEWILTSTEVPKPSVSLKGLVEAWWIEARAAGRKASTHESYSNTMAAFVEFLGHDDAKRVTRSDVIGFKDHRLASVNPRTRRPISAKTVKDSDLSGLKTIFGWAVTNDKMATNPAEGVTIKIGKSRRVRSKGFTETEALAILQAVLSLQRGQERQETFAAKRWVPWLCAYTGARVGELAQLRKEDVRREGKHWIITITPEAGTVKTNEARDVVLHPHLIELGFIRFVEKAAPGHLFLRPSDDGDVLGPLQGVKNRITEFVRTVVSDKNVAPNHGWRHRFKTVGLEVGIDHRILDAIQGQQPRNVSEGYGEVTIKTQAAAIEKLPRYDPD